MDNSRDLYNENKMMEKVTKHYLPTRIIIISYDEHNPDRSAPTCIMRAKPKQD